MNVDMRAKLEQEVDLTTWRDLRSHAGRDVLFLVSAGLDLAEVALAVGSDDSQRVQGLIDSQSLLRPSAAQMTQWERELDKTFNCLIVAPFVLAMEVEVPRN